MKKAILFIAVLVGITSTKAQTNDYLPMVREGVKWVYYKHVAYESTSLDKEVFEMYFKGDTVYNGIKFKKCYIKYPGREEIEVAWMNETNKCVSSDAYIEFIDFSYDDDYGFKIIDFSTPISFWKLEQPSGNNIEVQEIDPVMIGGISCKRYLVDKGTTFEHYQIEGVGYDYDSSQDSQGCTLIQPFYEPCTCTSWTEYRLHHMEDANGNVIYKGLFYNLPAAVNDVKVTETADDSYYNLMGQPVAHPEDAPGIYIHEGKKVVVK